MEAWIARDEDGKIFIYQDKPIKGSCYWWKSRITGRYFPILESDLSEDINPKWEDDEPIEVKLKIEKL